MVLFWAVGHPGAPEVISCRRLCILSGCQANSVCCFCTPLSAWTCSSKVRESRGEGIKHVVSSLILFLPLFSFDFFPLSYSFSLFFSCQFTLPNSLSVISSLPPSLCFSLFQSLSSCLPFSSSSLPFFCSCSKEIIFSGFSTKSPWGTSKNIFPISLF